MANGNQRTAVAMTLYNSAIGPDKQTALAGSMQVLVTQSHPNQRKKLLCFTVIHFDLLAGR